MWTRPRTWPVVVALCAVFAGCGNSEPSDVKKDKLDPESLKAMQNPPPGVPGAPAPGAQSSAPGKPSEGANPLGTQTPGSDASASGALAQPASGQ